MMLAARVGGGCHRDRCHGLLLLHLCLPVLCWPLSGIGRAQAPGENAAGEYDIRLLDRMSLEELLDLQIQETSTAKHLQHILWSPSAVTVYTQREIRASGAQTLADFLRRVPGMDVYEMDSTVPLVSIRSQIITDAPNRVLLLVDGQEAIMELTGMPLWGSLHVPLEDIDRLEVIRGPGSALYGANAFSGVINVVTVKDWSSGGEVSFRAGEHGDRYLMGRARINHPLRRGRIYFSGSVGTESIQSPSDPEYRFARDLLAHGVARYVLDDWLDLSLHGSYVEYSGMMPTPLKEMHLKDNTSHSVMGTASFKLGDRITLHAQLYHYRYELDARFRCRAYYKPLWIADYPRFSLESNQVDAKVQLDFRILDSLLLLGGGNVRYTDMSSSKIIPAEVDEMRGGGFMHLQWRPLNTLQLVGGVRVDLNSETEEAISPRVAVTYQPWTGQTFRLGYALAFRKPSFMERSLRFKFDEVTDLLDIFLGAGRLQQILESSVANPDVGNERIQSLEAGWRALLLENRLQVSVDFFYNRYLDVIWPIENSIESPSDLMSMDRLYYYDNQIDLWAIGSELEVRFRPTLSWHFWASLGARHVDLEGSELKADLEKDNIFLDELDPVLRVNFGGGYDPDRGPVVDLSFHYVTRYRSPHWDFRDSVGNATLDQVLGNTVLAIGRVGYRFAVDRQGWKLEAGVTGRVPIGATYREVAGFPADADFLDPQDGTTDDITGNKLVRLIDFYLRGSF